MSKNDEIKLHRLQTYIPKEQYIAYKEASKRLGETLTTSVLNALKEYYDKRMENRLIDLRKEILQHESNLNLKKELLDLEIERLKKNN